MLDLNFRVNKLPIHACQPALVTYRVALKRVEVLQHTRMNGPPLSC
jgi:hypothetical protein